MIWLNLLIQLIKQFKYLNWDNTNEEKEESILASCSSTSLEFNILLQEKSLIFYKWMPLYFTLFWDQ